MCVIDGACGSIIIMEQGLPLPQEYSLSKQKSRPREGTFTNNQLIHQKIQKSISLVLPYYVSVEYSLHETMSSSSSSSSEDDDEDLFYAPSYNRKREEEKKNNALGTTSNNGTNKRKVEEEEEEEEEGEEEEERATRRSPLTMQVMTARSCPRPRRATTSSISGTSAASSRAACS